MKRKLFGLMTLFLAVGALSSFAANDNNDKKCDDSKKCSKEQKCDKSKCDKGRKCLNPFEGLNLTAEQQAKLDELRPKACNKDAKVKDGKDANAGNKEKARGERPNPRQFKTEYLAKVKAILTPEQYVTFLENSFVNASSPKGMKGDKGKGPRPDHDHRDHGRR